MSLKLRIVSPERIVFVGDVDSVTVPGTTGEFQVLPNHAPLISSLEAGNVVYDCAEGRKELT
ncbi:MAG: F0F1 ATP synthase subunit epsilon, partial [Prevotella sp.]|nr:F0F1 ATP synthase subunit epsilon [Prevotella sp.]